jgi:ATP-dependent DNA helicase PIF1
LLDDDKEYIDGIKEASQWGSGATLRNLFATLLFSDSMSRPEYVWEETKSFLSDGILHHQRSTTGQEELQLDEDEIMNYTLWEIEQILRASGKSLHDYPKMPFPDIVVAKKAHNRLLQDEMRYDRMLLIEEHKRFVANLTIEQKEVYNTILQAVDNNKGGVFFLYGCGGTGKTFVWRTLSAALRSKGDIVLTVASSGIASLIIPGGRTAHSRFKIPLTPNEDSTCNITQGSDLAELIKMTKLIIWDEAPMMHRYCFEALDRTMRDIMEVEAKSNSNKSFGGKTIVFGEDFRQILPVITKGSRQDVVHGTLNSSHLWRQCKVLRLTTNMRLQNVGSDIGASELKAFAKWIIDIGDGKVGGNNDGVATLDIPDDILIHTTEDTVKAIVDSTYPSLTTNMTDPLYLQGRAILAPTLDIVEQVNQYVVSLNETEEVTYLSSDSLCRADSNVDNLNDIHAPEFLNGIKCSGVPNHELKLKVGIPVMLL